MPLNYDLNNIASSLKHFNPTKREFLLGLSNYGYKAVQTYYSSALWKTNAPSEILYDLFKNHKW